MVGELNWQHCLAQCQFTSWNGLPQSLWWNPIIWRLLPPAFWAFALLIRFRHEDDEFQNQVQRFKRALRWNSDISSLAKRNGARFGGCIHLVRLARILAV